MSPRLASALAFLCFTAILIALMVVAPPEPYRVVQAQTGGTQPAAIPCYVATTAGFPQAMASQNCRNSSGFVRGYSIFNTSGMPAWLKLYNLAGAPVCNSANGFQMSIPIPFQSPGVGGIVDPNWTHFYNQGVAYCVTGGTGLPTDGSAPPAGIYGVVNTGN